MLFSLLVPWETLNNVCDSYVWSRAKGMSTFKVEVKVTAMACPGQHTNHKIMEKSCWKAPQVVSSPTSCSKQGQLKGQTGYLGLYPVGAWKYFKDEDGPTWLSDLLQCLTFLMGKKILLISSVNFSFFHFMCMVSHPPTRQSCGDPGSVSLMTNLWALGAAVRCPPSCFFSWLNQSSSLSAPSHRASAPALSILVALSWTCSCWLMPSLWHFAFQRWLLFHFDTASVHVLSHYMLSADQDCHSKGHYRDFRSRWHEMA